MYESCTAYYIHLGIEKVEGKPLYKSSNSFGVLSATEWCFVEMCSMQQLLGLAE